MQQKPRSTLVLFSSDMPTLPKLFFYEEDLILVGNTLFYFTDLHYVSSTYPTEAFIGCAQDCLACSVALGFGSIVQTKITIYGKYCCGILYKCSWPQQDEAYWFRSIDFTSSFSRKLTSLGFSGILYAEVQAHPSLIPYCDFFFFNWKD